MPMPNRSAAFSSFAKIPNSFLVSHLLFNKMSSVIRRSSLFGKKFMSNVGGRITTPLIIGTQLFHHSPHINHSRKRRSGKFSVDRSALDNSYLFAKTEEEILRGKESATPLARDLLSYIQFKGPISLHDYMAQAANHALHGYYQSSQEKIGEKGDFVTAPELGQLFGEMLGIWVVLTWKAMGSPPKFNLIELGPGKGTLMNDVLKVGSKYEAFRNAINVNFVELSNDLRIKQLNKLRGNVVSENVKKIKDNETHQICDNIKATWYSLLHQVPIDTPCIIIGQEFLDAFPVHQFVYTENGWREKLVDIDESAESTRIFRFVLSPSATPATKSLLRGDQTGIIPENRPPIKAGDGIEISPLTLSTCEDIAKRVVATKGAAILIDYGEDFTQEDSLRGFKNHKQVHILSEPGQVDVTADVDFASCRKSAEKKGATVLPLQTQGQFLMNMGITERVEQLINAENVSDEDANQLFESMKMLVMPEMMGSKFKVMTVVHPELKDSIPGWN